MNWEIHKQQVQTQKSISHLLHHVTALFVNSNSTFFNPKTQLVLMCNVSKAKEMLIGFRKKRMAT